MSPPNVLVQSPLPRAVRRCVLSMAPLPQGRQSAAYGRAHGHSIGPWSQRVRFAHCPQPFSAFGTHNWSKVPLSHLGSVLMITQALAGYRYRGAPAAAAVDVGS
jgi:hypothetical protein